MNEEETDHCRILKTPSSPWARPGFYLQCRCRRYLLSSKSLHPDHEPGTEPRSTDMISGGTHNMCHQWEHTHNGCFPLYSKYTVRTLCYIWHIHTHFLHFPDALYQVCATSRSWSRSYPSYTRSAQRSQVDPSEDEMINKRTLFRHTGTNMDTLRFCLGRRFVRKKNPKSAVCRCKRKKAYLQ